MTEREKRQLAVSEKIADAAARAATSFAALCEVFQRVGVLLEEDAKKQKADVRDLQGNRKS